MISCQITPLSPGSFGFCYTKWHPAPTENEILGHTADSAHSYLVIRIAIKPVAQRLLPVICLLTSVALRAEQPRFSAMFADGSRYEGNTLSDWHQRGLQPRLEDRTLFDANNSMRWLRDRSLTPGPIPGAFIEMVTGDRLPGRVVGYVPGDASFFEQLPGHFFVELSDDFVSPRTGKGDLQPVRIVERYVRRIVWDQRKSKASNQSTAQFVDGRSLSFRAARFGNKSVSLLLDDDVRSVPYAELAEIHFANSNVWDSCFEELAALSPDAQSRLFQVETVRGSILTTSLSRLDASVHGNAEDRGRWLLGLHPAWSLDPLWVWSRNVCVRRSFSPNEVPLSRIAPTAINQSSSLIGSALRWSVNGNVRGAPLRVDNTDFAWGFGLHGQTSLSFDIPRCAQSFRSQFGLDAIAGDGGCVRGRVSIGSDKPASLFESEILTGSSKIVDTGLLNIAAAAHGEQQLHLEVDAVYENKPSGADPLDIRDYADWLDPMLLLDPAAISDVIKERLPSQLYAWKGWSLSVRPESELKYVNVYDAISDDPGRFRLGTVATGESFSLRRDIRLAADDKWLLLFVFRRIDHVEKPKLEVVIDDEPVAEFEVPLVQPTQDVMPLAVPLSSFHLRKSESISIEIRQHPGSVESPVFWQAITFADQLPTLYELFEDDREFVQVVKPDVDAATGGRVALHDKDAHCGKASIKVAANELAHCRFDKAIEIRENPKWGQFRFMRFAFRKSGKGRVAVELNQDNPDERIVRYDAGVGEPSWGLASRVWNEELPNEWIVITRDLFADFGRIDVSGLTLSTPDGEYALYDHVYLARKPADFDSIPEVPSAESTNQKARRELARPILDRVLPATVAIHFGEGRFGTGVIVSEDGNVLTSGHLVVQPDRPVIIRLADGRLVNGKTRGVCREMDVGMVRISDVGKYSFLPIFLPSTFPASDLHVGVAHKGEVPNSEKPMAHLLDVRRAFRGMIWTTFDENDFSTGGPLVDKEGRLIGIHSGRSSFGGFLYAQLDTVVPHLGRLHNGEVWGAWYPGTGPMMGVEITTTNEGCKVTEVYADTPAFTAGFRGNDIVTHVKGKSVVSLDDIYRLLGDNDPGQTVEVKLLRDGAVVEATIKLHGRTP